ncbi:MAG: hypothetical protein JSS07_10130 [Proteobacteria bacterium]|nr:hypothetical protein [Pseudomonadota bacterium]
MNAVKNLQKIVTTIAVGLFVGSVFAQAAKNQPVLPQSQMSVKLKSLEVIKTQEKGGDELFISITEFPLGKSSAHYQIPSPPSHWLSKYLNNVKDVVIWKKQSNQCEPLNLLITLVEEDYAPWNLDDSLGSVELKITCVGGKAVEQWTIPDKDATRVLNGQDNAFIFNKDNAQYKAVFQLE